MNSKEAFEKVKNFWLDNDGDDGWYAVKPEVVSIIERDLEVLDTLKKHLWIIPLITGEEVCSFYDDGIYSFTDKEDFNVVKEFLNDK